MYVFFIFKYNSINDYNVIVHAIISVLIKDRQECKNIFMLCNVPERTNFTWFSYCKYFPFKKYYYIFVLEFSSHFLFKNMLLKLRSQVVEYIPYSERRCENHLKIS